jgi:hypothetical protein
MPYPLASDYELCDTLLYSLFFKSWIAQRYSAGLRVDNRGFGSRQGLGIFLFTTASRPALRPTQPPIQWIPGALSLRVKRPGREADHSPPSSVEFMNSGSCTCTPPVRLHGVVLS